MEETWLLIAEIYISSFKHFVKYSNKLLDLASIYYTKSFHIIKLQFILNSLYNRINTISNFLAAAFMRFVFDYNVYIYIYTYNKYIMPKLSAATLIKSSIHTYNL